MEQQTNKSLLADTVTAREHSMWQLLIRKPCCGICGESMLSGKILAFSAGQMRIGHIKMWRCNKQLTG